MSNEEDNKLKRAHQLSAQGTMLSRAAEADEPTLRRALEAYTEAANLFEAASATADDATRQTFRMLVLQHRKFVRDLERRIMRVNSTPSSPSSTHSPSSSLPQVKSTSPFATVGPSRTGTGTPARPPAVRRSSGTPVGLSAGGGGVFDRPGLVHATSPPRPVPPFTLRPVDTVPSGPFGNPHSPKELYSSSSSSEPPDESFLLPGTVPDTYDPFSRFWANLENMLDEISIPRALSTAPVGMLAGAPPSQPPPRSKTKGVYRLERSPSPSESFYVVPRRPRDRSAEPVSNGVPSAKTNEELQLENEELRASLDALAKHAHKLEVANRSLTASTEQRDKLVASVVTEVRREAMKVRHDQEVMRSQMLASTAVHPSHQASAPPLGTEKQGSNDQSSALKTRIGELEAEIRLLKEDNSKLRGQVDKWNQRWDKLKAKKEAKSAAAKAARSSRSPDPPV